MLRLCQDDRLAEKRLIAPNGQTERLLLGLAERAEWFERQQHAMLLDHPLPCADNLAIDHNHNAEGGDNQIAVIRVENRVVIFVGNRILVVGGQQMCDG